jgi:transposase
MLEYLAGRPTAYLDEIQDFILNEFDVALSLTAIWQLLKRRKWSRKKAGKKALERSEPLRMLWRGRRMN